jgi:hypothetical protein
MPVPIMTLSKLQALQGQKRYKGAHATGEFVDVTM